MNEEAVKKELIHEIKKRLGSFNPGPCPYDLEQVRDIDKTLVLMFLMLAKSGKEEEIEPPLLIFSKELGAERVVDALIEAKNQAPDVDEDEAHSRFKKLSTEGAVILSSILILSQVC